MMALFLEAVGVLALIVVVVVVAASFIGSRMKPGDVP